MIINQVHVRVETQLERPDTMVLHSSSRRVEAVLYATSEFDSEFDNAVTFNS